MKGGKGVVEKRRRHGCNIGVHKMWLLDVILWSITGGRVRRSGKVDSEGPEANGTCQY